MGKVLIAILAVGWGLVLIPAGFRRRSERGNFSVLGLGASIAGLLSLARRQQKQAEPLWSSETMRSYAGGPVPPLGLGLSASQGNRRMSRSVRRQRQILLGLAAIAIVSLLLSLVPGLRMLIAVHAVTDFVLALYVMLLLRFKQTRPSVSSPTYGAAEQTRLPWAS